VVMGYGVRSGTTSQQHEHQSLFALLRGEKHPVAALFALYAPVDDSLVHMVLSDKDDSNTADFHPEIGFGLAYGTRNGKVQLLGTRRKFGLGLDA
jgi:hypothetical protein